LRTFIDSNEVFLTMTHYIDHEYDIETLTLRKKNHRHSHSKAHYISQMSYDIFDSLAHRKTMTRILILNKVFLLNHTNMFYERQINAHLLTFIHRLVSKDSFRFYIYCQVTLSK